MTIWANTELNGEWIESTPLVDVIGEGWTFADGAYCTFDVLNNAGLISDDDAAAYNKFEREVCAQAPNGAGTKFTVSTGGFSFNITLSDEPLSV
jgi:hypothetical protein